MGDGTCFMGADSAAALGETGSLGRVQAGYQADLISINLDQPHLMPSGNLLHILFECVNADDVSDMFVNGKLVMKNREVLTMDKERILYDAKKYQESL